MTDGPFKPEDFLVGVMPIATAEFAAKTANARYRELHPPVSEGIRFTAEDFMPSGPGVVLLNESTRLLLEDLAPVNAGKANAKLSRILAQGVRVWFCDGELKTVHLVQPVDAARTGIVVAIEEIK